MSSQGWPTLNSAMIAMVRTDEYRNGLSPTQAPVDGLKTLGSTMLHEVRRLTAITCTARTEELSLAYRYNSDESGY